MKYKVLHIPLMVSLILSTIFIGYFSLFSLLPYSWYTDVTKLEAMDVCLGSDIVTYYSEREPRWGMLGESYGQIVSFKGDQIIRETTISRGTPSNKIGWAYEENTTIVTYNTRWSEPFNSVGVYGANEWLTIYPLPFISVSTFISAEDNKFNVVECN